MNAEQVREIARAAKMRDWAAVDAVLEDVKIGGSTAALRGFADARRALGTEPPLPAIDRKNVVMFNDLPASEQRSVCVAGGQLHGHNSDLIVGFNAQKGRRARRRA